MNIFLLPVIFKLDGGRLSALLCRLPPTLSEDFTDHDLYPFPPADLQIDQQLSATVLSIFAEIPAESVLPCASLLANSAGLPLLTEAGEPLLTEAGEPMLTEQYTDPPDGFGWMLLGDDYLLDKVSYLSLKSSEIQRDTSITLEYVRSADRRLWPDRESVKPVFLDIACQSTQARQNHNLELLSTINAL